jgi:hypothetical protein
VQGIRGRLVALATKDDKGQTQVRLELEIENINKSANPFEIWWGGWNAMLDLSVEDEAGKKLPKFPPLSVTGNEIGVPPFWLELLSNSSMRSLIAKSAYEYTASDNRVFLRPTVWQMWELPPVRNSKLYLSGKLISLPSPDPRNHAWSGSLALPRVELP